MGVEFITADFLEWAPAQPPDRFDLVFGSPPYCDARTYGIDAQRGCAGWVEWMLDVSEAATRVCRGPVIWVVAGVTRGRCYWPAPEGLAWEWWKRGGDHHLYRPCFFHRNGIPGSGGDDWFRADVEYILCLKKPGKLPWSDNTVMGHIPKYGPGGEMSNRLSSGERVNQWGGKGGNAGARRANGKRDKRWRRADGQMETQGYEPPVLANPGNLIQDTLTLAEFIDILMRYEQMHHITASQILRDLQAAHKAARLREWFYGVCLQIEATSLLQSSLRGTGEPEVADTASPVSGLRKNTETQKLSKRERRELSGDAAKEVLQPQLPRSRDAASRRATVGGVASSRPPASTPQGQAGAMRTMPNDTKAGGSSPRRRCNEQCVPESTSDVFAVSSCETQKSELHRREVWAAILREGLLQQALPEIQEVWRSVSEMFRAGETAENSSIVQCQVGGGHMGSPLASLSEAPFPESLAEWFVRSCCPEGGLVLDPFSGSGTTMAVCQKHGRNGVGVDIRESQAELGRTRCAQQMLPF